MATSLKLDGDKIRRLRKARRLSQAETARRVGVSLPTINRAEKGHPSSYPTAEGLARVLGVDVDWLLEESPVEIILGNDRNGKEAELAAPIDLADSTGTAYMDRVEAGEVEEVLEDEDKYFDFLPRYLSNPTGQRHSWTMESFERDLAWGLAALARRDRDNGAKAIRRVLRNIREHAEEKG